MEAETGHVSYRADILLLSTYHAACSERVSGVTHNRYTTDCFLNARGEITQGSTIRFERSEEVAFPLYDVKDSVIVANDAVCCLSIGLKPIVLLIFTNLLTA